MRNELETTTIERDVELCEDCGDLRGILSKYDGYYLNWQRWMNRFLDESGLSYNRLAQKCGISKNTLKKWCREGGAPRSRNTFLKIGFGLGMNPTEVSRLLVRYGGYHGLYAKDLFDAVCIYALERRCLGDERYTYEYAERLYDRCLESRASGCDSAEEPPFLRTEVILKQINKMETEEDFIRFSAEHGDLLTGRGIRLAAWLEDYLRAKNPEDGQFNVSEIFSLLGVPKRFGKTWSMLTVHGTVPRREQLIALALHPEITLSNAIELLAVTKDEEQRRRCREIVEEYTVNCYRCSEEETDSVSGYVKELLTSLDMEEARELLELI